MNRLLKLFDMDTISILIQYFDVSVQMWMVLVWEFPISYKLILDNKDIYKMAIKDANFDVVKWAINSGWHLTPKLGTEICNVASEHGNLYFLNYMRNNGYKFSRKTFLKAKDLKTLEHLTFQECPHHRDIYKEILTRHLNGKLSEKETLKILKLIKTVFPKIFIEQQVVKLSMKSKNLKIASFFRLNCYDPYTDAAEAGNLPLVKHFISKYEAPINKGSFVLGAVRSGNEELIKWLKVEMKGENMETVYVAAESGNLVEFNKQIKKKKFSIDINETDLFDAALEGDNLNIVKWLVEHKAPIEDKHLITQQAKSLPILKYLVMECGFPLTETGIGYFATNGNVEMVEWSINQSPGLWNPISYEHNPDENDSLEMINWLVSNDYISVELWKEYYNDSFLESDQYDDDTEGYCPDDPNGA